MVRIAIVIDIINYFNGKINVCYNESVHNNLYR